MILILDTVSGELRRGNKARGWGKREVIDGFENKMAKR